MECGHFGVGYMEGFLNVESFLEGHSLKEKLYNFYRPASLSEFSNKSRKRNEKKGKDNKEVTSERKCFYLEIPKNPSKFSVYASIRQIIMEDYLLKKCLKYSYSKCEGCINDNALNFGGDGIENISKLPKMVMVGLSGIYELIRETHLTHPNLCSKSLQVLFNVLQSQQPESLKNEPIDIIESLYSLLMDLSQIHEPPPDNSKESCDTIASLACSSLISLVVAFGDPGKILAALSAMFISPNKFAQQHIKLPLILSALHKSVYAILIGRLPLPLWLDEGLKKEAEIASFVLKETLQIFPATRQFGGSNIASDGVHLYIQNKRALFKVGSGFQSTLMGHVYAFNPELKHLESDWMGYCKEQLLYMKGINGSCLITIDTNSLLPTREISLLSPSPDHLPLFTDGHELYQIQNHREMENYEVFKVELNKDGLPLDSMGLQLKLSQKKLFSFGGSSYDKQEAVHEISCDNDEEICSVTSCKDFGLLRLTSGRVLYRGRGVMLGLKGSTFASNWTDLPIIKSPKIMQMSTGHEGYHVCFVSEDGVAYFAGVSKRGEDGESSNFSKVRRAIKAVKPRRMMRVENKHIVFSACNYATTALVTREGEVFMFGKDAYYCDAATGLLGGSKLLDVASISIGKAHVIILTKKGQIYSFGLNNKGQCGRGCGSSPDVLMFTKADDVQKIFDLDEEVESESCCLTGNHTWHYDCCTVCTSCKQCTGFGSECLNSSKDRNPGELCGCGVGDPGCLECGICKACAKKMVSNFDFSKVNEGVKFQGQFFRRPLSRAKNKRSRERTKDKTKIIFPHISEMPAALSDQEQDAVKLACLPIGAIEVTLNPDEIVVQVSCGLHHSVLLTSFGNVMVFGSNQFGQLGLGDILVRNIPTKVDISNIKQVAAGSHHTLLLTHSGQIFTAGSDKNRQLGREVNEKHSSLCFHPIPGVGASFGRSATWIHASGDQTFFRADDSLVTPDTLASANIFANSYCIGIIPQDEGSSVDQCIMVDKRDGSCKIHMDELHWSKRKTFCFDPHFDVVWSYDEESQKVCCLSVIEGVMGDRKNLFRSVGNPLDPLFSIPSSMNSSSTRSRVATNVLACLDVMTLGHMTDIKISELETDKPITGNLLSKEDFSVVNRFESHGGGWGYSGQSVEAIRFSCDTDIIIGGFGLFGGRGEYSARIKLFELGAEVLDNEPEGELLAESDEVLFRCPPKEKHVIMFDEPVLLQSNHWYVAWARISGPSSDCGSNGQSTVFSDDQVIFKFRCSGKSNNGTDVNAGQIPQLLYKIASSSNSSSNYRSKIINDQTERVLILSRSFTHSVSSTSFESLISLLNWSWSTFCSLGIEVDNLKCVSQMVALSDLKRFVYIIETCLRLLRTYINICYPSQGDVVVKESSRICECVGDTRSLLRRIIIESGLIVKEPSPKSNIYQDFMLLKNNILSHCQKTFKSCFRVFYPTDGLKWHCTCELLSQFDPARENKEGIGKLLSCVLEALCHSSINLSTIFAICPKCLHEAFTFEENKTNCPILVSQMIVKLQPSNTERLTFNEVVKKLIEISTHPFLDASDKSSISHDPQLIKNSSSITSVLIFQLISSSICSRISQQSQERPIIITPSRFSRISQGVFWNSGNGSPDAVCFSVDKPGILIVGVGFYAGGEGTSTFEVEILADHSIGKASDPSDVHWGCIELVKGSYDIDDCINDIVQVRFNKPVLAEENVKYALRLRNYCNRTRNGDDGLNKVVGPDGTTFTFTSCSLSINGTNHIRGQLPIILYQSTHQNNDLISESNKAMQEQEARQNLMFVVLEIFKATIQVMTHIQQTLDAGMMETLSHSPLVHTLIPLMCSSIVTYLVHDLHNCIEILSPLSTLLSHVTKLQQIFGHPKNFQSCEDIVSVESEHPYKPATVSTHHVKFPDEIQWMSIEFDPQCCTSQPEDYLQIYLPHSTHPDSLINSNQNHFSAEKTDNNAFTKLERFIGWVPVYKKMCGQNGWPAMALLLPGNELSLSLHSSSCNQKEEKNTSFGFKCQISGFPGSSETDKGLIVLEEELVKLSAICAEMLLKKEVLFSFCKEPEKETLIIENAANEIYKLHSSLLVKSFPLLYLPTIHEALDGRLPIDNTSHQKKFLIDFIQKNPGTSGGRFAVWLQPEPYLEPKNCKVACAKKDLFCGWPCMIFIQAKDQYGCPADLANLKLEAKAILMLKSTSEHKLSYSVANTGSPCFGGHPPPKLEIAYYPSMKDKKEVYHSITMMKEYELYSFEELRFSTSMIMKPTENMSIKNELDGSYTASWTPNSSGFYDILITVDGIRIGEPLKIFVKDAPHGNFPQLSNILKHSEIKSCKQSRQFLCKQSAGLRIRLHPSLQSEQIGILENNTVISFTNQLQNDDGTWLKLSPETMRKCHLPYNGVNEGWTLQYHQHLRKTFLFPLQDKEQNKENICNNFTTFKVVQKKHLKDSHIQNNKDYPTTFVASKCGPLGHKVLISPKSDSSMVGKIAEGGQILAIREKKTSEGVWLELNDKSKENYCFDQSDEAWCLAESCVGDIFFTCFKKNLKCTRNDCIQFNNTNNDENSEDNFNSRKTNGESQINGNGITPPATPKKTPIKTLYSKPSVGFKIFSEDCSLQCDSNLNDRQIIEATSKVNFLLKKVIKVSTENHSRSTSCSPPRSNNLHKKLRSSSLPVSNTDTKSFSVYVLRDNNKKFIRKQKLKINHEKGKMSPSVANVPALASNPTKALTSKVMSPSLAECLRAMFAAFLWHKDIVQDAMACASFLKFHPTYAKDSLGFNSPNESSQHFSSLRIDRESIRTENSQNNGGLNNFFNNFKKSTASSENNSFAFNEPLNGDKPHIPKLSTLEHLVFFWDQLNVATMKAIEESFMLTRGSKDTESFITKKHDNENLGWLESDSLQESNLKSAKNEVACDLCGNASTPPITYHMKQFHPGCGKDAGGQGYNSEGVYCDGWAGNCGDGGNQTSTWYLMCTSCREYYHSKWQSLNPFEVERNRNSSKTFSLKNSSSFCLSQVFNMLKSNALFILDLNFFESSIKSEFKMPDGDEGIFKCSSSSQMPFTFLDLCRIDSNYTQMEHLDSKNSCDKTFERSHVSQRPRSIYEGYKFDASHASATLYNLSFMRGSDVEYPGDFQFPFHRSISEMGPALGREVNVKQNLMKNGSSFLKDVSKNSKGLSLLNHPSFQLSSMIQLMNKWIHSNNKPFFEYILEQSFMKFCIQSHDLEHLVVGMKLALCKATCRIYALQAFNWLLRKVTLQSCLHDLLWHFVSSLMLPPHEMKLGQHSDNLNRGGQSDFESDAEVTCRHPLDDIPLAEGLSNVVTFCFHTFLQSLSDVMMFLPRGTSVQQMAVRCWSLSFKPSDHEFLHQSDIFKSISKILSESEQVTTSIELGQVGSLVLVETLKDLTHLMEINASTHKQMISSITDCSTETFWESGDDDRNKIKTLTFSFTDNCLPQLICVYVDNVKDHGNKVSSVSVSSGLNQDEVQMDSQQEIDLRYVGWINMWLNERDRNCIKLILKGPDGSLRIRQVKLLGHIETADDDDVHGFDSYELQCLNCETETLRVFKLLTTQVFKSLISSEENCEDKHVTGKMEHVVGILFSQHKLTNMQKQVCAHILQAIRKETVRVHDAWELAKINELSDNYCFELLNLVLALSGSAVGCAFVAQQLCLLEDLLTLLHTSSPRVQRQVVSLLRRLLVHIKPKTFAEVQNLKDLDWDDTTNESDIMDYVGIMDVFLICIVKCLSVQIKKCRTNIDSQPLADFTSFSEMVCSKIPPLKWWYNGSSSRQLAESIINLFKDISDGKLTEEWAVVTKKALSRPILALSQMPEEFRAFDVCIKTPTLWLTLASLCILSEEHMELLSSSTETFSSITQQSFTCDNHDDGNTTAVMKCSICGNLCADCDRVLHLSRKTKLHQRHIFREEREAIKVDCHEGCGRVKLFWILMSSDSRNLKAVVEFRDELSNGLPYVRSNLMCRFCGIFFVNDSCDDGHIQVCKSPECLDLARRACSKILNCGHLCGGIIDESNCLPCLRGCKTLEVRNLLLKQDADDMCMICFSDTLSRAPSIQLACGHVFHMHCCEKILVSKWTGPRITFGFSLCPICKAPISHPSLDSLLKPIKDRFEDVRRKALMRLEYEGLSCSESIVTPGSMYYNDPSGYAMHRYAYYVCSKCDKAYFGGDVRCEDQVIGGPQAAEGYDASELVCGACSDVSRAQICPKHGVDFLEYKCRYCCSVAVFFCFGTTHFCSACHDDFQRITAIPVGDLPACPAGPKTKQLESGQCPLSVAHPPTGTEFALGCGICRNAHTF